MGIQSPETSQRGTMSSVKMFVYDVILTHQQHELE